jgi:hypothetical protein
MGNTQEKPKSVEKEEVYVEEDEPDFPSFLTEAEAKTYGLYKQPISQAKESNWKATKRSFMSDWADKFFPVCSITEEKEKIKECCKSLYVSIAENILKRKYNKKYSVCLAAACFILVCGKILKVSEVELAQKIVKAFSKEYRFDLLGPMMKDIKQRRFSKDGCKVSK